MKLRLLILLVFLSAFSTGQNAYYIKYDSGYKINGVPLRAVKPAAGVNLKYINDSLIQFWIDTSRYKGNSVQERTPDTAALTKKYNAIRKSKNVARALSTGIVYQPPIYIQKGGTYTGNYKSDDPNTPAILVLCYDSVIITGCNILSSGEGIKAYGGSRLNVHHNNFQGQSNNSNQQWGRALNDYQPQTLTFENNYVEHTGGLMVDHGNENTKSANFRYNLIRNTDRRRTDGSAGDLRASILFNTVTTIAAEISYNKFENILDSSFIEDNINLGNTGGTALSPINIHDNFVKGAYPAPRIYPPTGTVGYSGSGLTVEDNGGVNAPDQVSRWINITNNQIVSVGNGGLNVNAGHDIYVTGNRLISSGMYPDGTPTNLIWGAAACWNGSGLPLTSFYNVVYKNNTVGWVRPDQNTVYKGVTLKGRNDWVQVAGSPYNINPDDNISLPNPITLATELNEDVLWSAKLNVNKITVGNAVNNPSPASTVTIKLGQKATGTIYPVNVKGDTVTYKSITAVSNDATIFTISTITGGVSITPVKAGTSSGTITLTTNGGKTLTKSFSIEVTATPPTIDNEAVDFKITFKVT